MNTAVIDNICNKSSVFQQQCHWKLNFIFYLSLMPFVVAFSFSFLKFVGSFLRYTSCKKIYYQNCIKLLDLSLEKIHCIISFLLYLDMCLLYFWFFLKSRPSHDAGWLAHLVSRFASNTRMTVDASSSPPVSHVI